MSFYVNDSSLNTITFNGNDVNSVYYNNNLVWEKDWDTAFNWDNASWDDIYQICKLRQRGVLTKYPSSITLGASKYVEVARTSTSSYAVPMYLIGIDQDGTGVLTFQALDGTGEDYYYCEDGYTKSYCNYNASNLKTQCANFYNNCKIKNYIKPLSKKYGVSQTSTSTTTQSLYVWLPSVSEMGVSAADNPSQITNEGTAYAFFTSGLYGEKYSPHYHTRSVCYEMEGVYSRPVGSTEQYYVGDKHIAIVSHSQRYQTNEWYWGGASSTATDPDSTSLFTFAPAFAIG